MDLSSRKELVVFSVLLLAVFTVYSLGLSGPFLFDDAPNLIDNERLTTQKSSLLDWWGAAQSSGAGVLRRPIAMMSFALQIPSGPPATAFALKLGNVLLHLICGVLLFVLAWNLRAAMALSGDASYRYLPILAAGLWLLSPLLVSTVLYPVQRMAQLSTLFVLAGLVCFARYRYRWAKSGAAWDEFFALALWLLVFTVLAVFSKENGVLLPWLVLILESCLLRGRWNGGYSPRVQRVAVAAALAPLLVSLALIFWQLDWFERGYNYRDFSLSERLWTECRLLWQYLGWFVLPRLGELGLFHDDVRLSLSWLSPITTAVSALAWVGVLAVGYGVRRQFPWLLMACAFFLAGHSIESGILPLELVFEHRNYMPTIGAALCLAAGLGCITETLRKRGSAWLSWLPIGVFLLLFAVSLTSRVLTWSSDMQLSSVSYGRHPDSRRSAHFYANTLLEARNSQTVQGEQSTQYLMIARHEFERLHLNNALDLSALVMLYVMDSQYVTETSDPERWFSGIERSVGELKLKATEYAAMRALLNCVNGGGCRPDAGRLNELVKVFSERYFDPYAGTQLFLQLYGTEGASSREQIPLLESAILKSPSKLSLYYPLVSAWLDEENYAAAHLVVMALLEADTAYRHLSVLNALFDTTR